MAAVEIEDSHDNGDGPNTHPVVHPQRLFYDLPRGGRHDGDHDHSEHDINNLKKKPELPRDLFYERAIVVDFEDPRQFEGEKAEEGEAEKSGQS